MTVVEMKLTLFRFNTHKKKHNQKRNKIANLRVPGNVDEVEPDEESGNNENNPGNGLVLVPAEIFTQPEQRMYMLVLAPVLLHRKYTR